MQYAELQIHILTYVFTLFYIFFNSELQIHILIYVFTLFFYFFYSQVKRISEIKFTLHLGSFYVLFSYGADPYTHIQDEHKGWTVLDHPSISQKLLKITKNGRTHNSCIKRDSILTWIFLCLNGTVYWVIYCFKGLSKRSLLQQTAAL